MPRLSIDRSGVPDQLVRVDRPCTLGADPTADVASPALGDDSLRVTPLSIGAVIVATAPVVVGQRQVAPGTPRLVRNGERAGIGSATITVVGDPPPEGTRELAGAILAGLDPTPATGPGILIVQGAGAGQRYPVGPRLVIGRGAEADVSLEGDPLVSRRHVELERSGEVVRARDLGSKNGIVVNGRRHRGSGVVLRQDDELIVGETVLVLDDPASGPSIPGLLRPAQDERDMPVPTARRPRTLTLAIAFASAALLGAALLFARAAAG